MSGCVTPKIIVSSRGHQFPVKLNCQIYRYGPVFDSLLLLRYDGSLFFPAASGAHSIWRIFSLDLFLELGIWFDNTVFSDCDSGRCVRLLIFEKDLLAYGHAVTRSLFAEKQTQRR